MRQQFGLRPVKSRPNHIDVERPERLHTPIVGREARSWQYCRRQVLYPLLDTSFMLLFLLNPRPRPRPSSSFSISILWAHLSRALVNVEYERIEDENEGRGREQGVQGRRTTGVSLFLQPGQTESAASGQPKLLCQTSPMSPSIAGARKPKAR